MIHSQILTKGHPCFLVIRTFNMRSTLGTDGVGGPVLFSAGLGHGPEQAFCTQHAPASTSAQAKQPLSCSLLPAVGPSSVPRLSGTRHGFSCPPASPCCCVWQKSPPFLAKAP